MTDTSSSLDPVAVIGWSCRLPGAASVSRLWPLLAEGRCAVAEVPADRFARRRFEHPRPLERGKTYTWAAGVLDDIWGFDPGVFGISPREAEQMDPQQRILLELAWEALEDAGIPPSCLAGSETGVFIGASQTDYAHTMFSDPPVADPHFATGNALAILANRISYIFDLRGPSVTLDTACSSSLVALHQAMEALHSGRIDTAIVGGINVIASPAEFITFSQAQMLSPTGRCHAFSADADGYVRAEGGIILVLCRAARAAENRHPIHGAIVASEVNSDGRTNGISLPSAAAQKALLDRVYSRAGIDPNRLAFVEAHGTGTPVGDPIEAEALGQSLGRTRAEPLPIGSIKTNIGHAEAASGLAGLLKAMLALNHGVLPRSLHFARPNPAIAFDELNLKVCDEPLPLTNPDTCFAGVNSFGFGGTNAHVVIRRVTAGQRPADGLPAQSGRFFALSAATGPALVALARKYELRLTDIGDHDMAAVAGAIAHRRDHLAQRLIVSATRSREVREALTAFIAGVDHPRAVSGTASGRGLPIGFVYSGNGGQWAGMGVAAYRHNALFRRRFDEVDAHFSALAGWSLKDALLDPGLADRLTLTSLAQPLIFAIQCAATAALRSGGVHPSAVAGHSVGEVAAAEAAGALDLSMAVRVIYFRSKHQETVRGAGRMAAVLSPPEQAEEWIRDFPGVEIAAVNSHRSVTVAGPCQSLRQLGIAACDHGIAVLDLELDYPFHTAMMLPIERHLIADLRDISPRASIVPFVSTVTGSCLPGTSLDARYWWQNIRHPVQFRAAVMEMARLGVRYFIEIGPRATLLRHIADNLATEPGEHVTAAALERDDQRGEFVERTISKAYVAGARLDLTTVFGSNPAAPVPLPGYPWQRRKFRVAPTPEAIGTLEERRRPFSGSRSRDDSPVWQAHIDTALFPALADHRIGDQIIFPGTGFLEIALAVTREWLAGDQVALAHFEIINPLDLSAGDSRLVMTRVSPDTNILEIFSRPRLTDADWLLHCRGKMLRCDVRPAMPTADGATVTRLVDGDEIYRIATASGFQYGPAFRLVKRVAEYDGGLLAVELDAISGQAENFILDPVRLDACCHGLLTVFSELRAGQRGVGYVPVRTEQAVLLVPDALPQRALIKVRRKGERSIVADFYFRSEDGALIAAFRGVHCQAAQTRRLPVLATSAFLEGLQLIDGSIMAESGLDISVGTLIGCGRAQGVLTEAIEPAGGAGLLIEGWALAAAYELALGVADETRVDPQALAGNGRLPPELGPWLEDLLAILEAAGLARRERRYWEIVADPLLPSAASLVNDLAREHPECAAELLVAGAISGIVMRASADRAITGSSRPILTPAVLDFYDSAAASRRDGGNAILQLLEDERIWPTNRALRILQIGCGPLTKSLSELQRRRNFSLAIVEPDRRRRDTAIRRLSNDVVFAAPDELRDLGSFDLIVSVEALHRLPSDVIQSDLRRAVAPRGLLLAVEQGRSAFACMMSGFDPGTSAQPDFRTRPRQPDDWVAVLAAAGFEEARSHNLKCGYPPSSLIIARAARSDPPADPGAASGTGPEQARSITVLADPTGPGRRIAMLLARILAGRGIDVFLDGTLKTSDGPNVVQFLGGAHEQGDPMARLTERCMEIKSCAERLGTTSGTIWHVHRRALASEAGEIDPLATGTWAFSRTVANEYPNLRVRRIDVAAGVPAEVVAARLADIIISGTPETDIQIAADSIRALRVARLDAALARLPVDALPALRLERGVSPKKKFAWRAFERTAPGPGEVEIAVEATGLNFRDVMWALSLLPDDILEDGLAGPTLGCECTGKILRLGPAVTGLAVGDPVAAFAASGFATHVTVPAHCVAPLPAQIGCEAGATIPVAFLTAYYSLVTLARLKRGEWVLIHGGAGGVGLAAIQIARARGAHIVASVGSAAKGDLLKALGVDHVLDSRANSFADDVRALVKAGVDVVLNSLAGEAMERGLDCLRPFGRFVEIGKRDYAANTHVGLRPFRKNLTYFGVDIDQLLARDDNIGTKIFAGLMKKFDKGTFTPLPHSVFEATDLADAFHLMQHSRHIGKIVVRRPRPEIAGAPGASFSVSPRGTHVITGGFGGLGLEAAKWLVEMGARSLALIGRSGAASQEAQDAVAEFARRGVRVYAEPCDISDRHAAEQLFDRLGRTMPPVVGVLHAAMVLDDGLIANLDRERFYRVLAPKVIGAENLGALTRDMPLDYFVLFSSATTLMGNPGQGNYVAANAYMEGLARRRRQEGLKALAVGWGPITDVGVLARSERLRSRFQKLTGVGGLRAADAIALLARALEQPQTADLAVITISSTEGPFPADRLPVLASPTYGTVVGTAQQDAERETKRLDVHQLAADKGVEAARRALADIIVAQLARILRAGEEEISAIRPLGEMGVDSLMAVEVAMNLEESFGIHLALTNSIGSLTVTGLADKIVADLGLSNSRAETSMVRSLVDRHAETVDATQMAALEQIASDAFGVQGSALA